MGLVDGQGGRTHQVKSQPPEEDAGGTEAAAIAAAGGRAGSEARGPHTPVGRLAAAREEEFSRQRRRLELEAP